MAGRRYDPRVHRGDRLSTTHHDEPSGRVLDDIEPEVTVDLGWGRLLFGQTFTDQARVLDVLLAEEPGARDIAMYLRDPHVIVGQAPAELFIDPSLTFRLWLHAYRSARQPIRGVVVRKMERLEDAESINTIYAANGMVTAPPQRVWENQLTQVFTYLVAEDADTGAVIGTVTGVDHRMAFNDPESGSSLWSLAVDPQSPRAGVGEALVRTLAERYKARGRHYLDLSVLHDNEGAIRLYTKLGFERVPVFAVKRKNPINEPLFTTSTPGEADLNPYARIIADEAHRRGIAVRVVDAESGLLELSFGGRVIQTRESLSELTTAVAMTRCDDKRLTRALLAGAGLAVPRGRLAAGTAEDEAFLDEVGELVVKPVRGEQGSGVTVGVRTVEQLHAALAEARRLCPQVLLEERVTGDDLRVIVIDHRVVAAAVRKPPEVVGDGRHTVEELIAKQSRRRAAATGGESTIPIDDHTKEVVGAAGYTLDEVPPAGEVLQVRRAANLHQGGTIHDVTDRLHPELARAAVTASQVLDIPVVGMDLLVPDVEGPEHVIIEANERPGLANHEPQPTAQAFLDLLFPRSAGSPAARRAGA